MLLALAWLTVSLPFVYGNQLLHKEAAKETKRSAEDGDNANPLANTTEEKTESGINTLSEYLHDIHTIEHSPVALSKQYKHHAADVYLAFHPEMICPPPDFPLF